MGGVKKAIGKLLGGGSSSVVAEPVKSTQATSQATIAPEDSVDRNKKRVAAKGKKKLQIPMTSTTTGVSTSGGTGLGTGA